MKKLFELILGLIFLGYPIYVCVQIYYAATGTDGITWDDISGHLIVLASFFGLFGLGLWAERKEKKAQAEAAANLSGNNAKSEATTPEEPQDTFNPYADVLKFDSIYLQSTKTWWNDSDGDYHEHGTDYAALRFYEDGTVIGVRRHQIPHINQPDTYTYKGTWTVDKNDLSFELEKVADLADRIEIYISPDEEREMKYAGHIADDESLIKAGKYTCTIKGDSLLQDAQTELTYQKTSDLILTADDDDCGKIAAYFKDSPLLFSVFEDTGNYYTNGETGPEWFTVHLRTLYHNKDLVEAELEKAGIIVTNQFWS